MSGRRLLLLAAAAATCGLALYLHIARDSAAAAPYILVVMFAYLAGSPRWVWTTACVCTLLSIVGATYMPAGEAGRLVAKSLFAIWLPAVPCARALKERSERARLESLIDLCGDAIVSRTFDGVVTGWNKGAERLYGFKKGEILGRRHDILIPEDRRDELDGVRQRLQNGEAVSEFETVRIPKYGEPIQVSITVSPIRNTEGELIGMSTIARDITERNRLAEVQQEIHLSLERRVEKRTQELARANAALERSNMELQQFAFVASHDLQTPLRAIAGFAQFLRADYHDKLDDSGKEYIDRIVRGAVRLQELIHDLLELSRVESRAAPFAPVALQEVFEHAVDALHASIRDSSAEVTCDELPTVQGDQAQLVHLLQNLIENGIKYRGDGTPRIRVSADRNWNEWTIAVADNGIGIAAEHHEKIFEIFRRLHTTHAYPGTGIGLSLCRRIVNRYGGRIWVESAEGQGSRFMFTIPAAGATDRGESAWAPLIAKAGDSARVTEGTLR